MKKLLNSSLAILALAFALLVSGKTAWAVTTTGGSTVTTITAQNINTSGAKTYSTVLPATANSEIIKIKATSPGVLKMTITGMKTDAGVWMSLHSGSPQPENILNYVEFDEVTQGSQKIMYTNLETKGTYYLHMMVESAGGDQQVKYKVQEYVQGGTLTLNKTLKAGVTANTEGLYKIKVTKTGILKVQLKELVSSSNVAYGLRLYNSKKKAYTSSSSSYGLVKAGKTGYFAVTKGTYYIGVTSMVRNSSGSSYVYPAYPAAISLKPTFTAWSDQLSSNTTQKKAKSITKGKTIKSMVLPTEKTSKARWFKFTMPKNAVPVLTVQSYMSAGELKFEIRSSKLYTPGSRSVTGMGSSKNTLVYNGSGNTKLYKGTYYIKVTPTWKGSSGAYAFKLSYK